MRNLLRGLSRLLVAAILVIAMLALATLLITLPTYWPNEPQVPDVGVQVVSPEEYNRLLREEGWEEVSTQGLSEGTAPVVGIQVLGWNAADDLVRLRAHLWSSSAEATSLIVKDSATGSQTLAFPLDEPTPFVDFSVGAGTTDRAAYPFDFAVPSFSLAAAVGTPADAPDTGTSRTTEVGTYLFVHDLNGLSSAASGVQLGADVLRLSLRIARQPEHRAFTLAVLALPALLILLALARLLSTQANALPLEAALALLAVVPLRQVLVPADVSGLTLVDTILALVVAFGLVIAAAGALVEQLRVGQRGMTQRTSSRQDELVAASTEEGGISSRRVRQVLGTSPESEGAS